jgi:hypothetical protein
MTTRLTCAAGIALLAGAPAFAQVPRQSLDDLNTKVRIGDSVQVVNRDGTVIRGRFDGVAGPSLRLRTRGTILEIQETQIAQVRAQRPEGDGVLIGLGIGALAGLTYVQIHCRGAGEHEDCIRAGSVMVGAPAAVAGALVDLGLKTFEVVFQRAGSSTRRWRISPMLDGRRTGIGAIIMF